MVPRAPSIPKLLAASLRELRQLRGWSQAELAERLDVSVTYVGLLERGRRVPALPMLVTMSEVFGVDLDALVGERQQPDRWLQEAMLLLRALPPGDRRAALAMLRGLSMASSSADAAADPMVFLEPSLPPRFGKRSATEHATRAGGLETKRRRSK